jgi:recombinational DNA repair ATPase RecF
MKKAQTFITGTDREVFVDAKSETTAFFLVDSGEVTRVEKIPAKIET